MKRFVSVTVLSLLLACVAPAQAQIASEVLYNLDFVDLYAEVTPDRSEMQVMADLFLQGNGSDPVVLRCDGNFQRWEITGEQKNLAFGVHVPYFYLYNLASGPQVVHFKYLVRREGWETVNGGLIRPDKLELNAGSYWYPRNVASDPHQVILHLVSPDGYLVSTNASMTKDVPNNFKRLRRFLLSNPLAEGITLQK